MGRIRVKVTARVKVRMFCRNQGTEGSAACTAALRKEEVEELHLSYG